MKKLDKLHKDREALLRKLASIDKAIIDEQSQTSKNRIDLIKSTLNNIGLEIRSGYSVNDSAFKFMVVHKDLPEISHIEVNMGVEVYLVDGTTIDYYADDRLYGHAVNNVDVWFDALIDFNERYSGN